MEIIVYYGKFKTLCKNSYPLYQGSIIFAILLQMIGQPSQATKNFINENVNQWPLWTNVKGQDVSKLQKYVITQGKWNVSQTIYPSQIVYQATNTIPQPGYIGRSPQILYYKYYTDVEDKVVYFYAFRQRRQLKNEKIERRLVDSQLRKDRKYFYQSIRVVPLSIAETCKNPYIYKP